MEFINNIFQNISIIELVMFIGGIAFFASKLEENSKASKQLLESEIKHVVALMEINHRNLREDISRLEKKQEESNKIKERLAMQEVLTADVQAMLKSHISEH